MFSVGLALLLQSITVALRLSGRNGSFPRPLTPEEEEEALRRHKDGDPAARDLLIEHNLRLVAHVIKKYYDKRKFVPYNGKSPVWQGFSV